MHISIQRRLAFALLLLCGFALSAHALLADWAYWRGPSWNGVATDTGLPSSWSDDPKSPENFHWKAPYGCRSTPIIMNGRVYINNQVNEGINEQERVMCLNAADGKLVWEKKFNVFLTDIVSVRLGWTMMVGDPATGNVYWHGTQGHLVCFDKDGTILWQRQLSEQDGRTSGYGGRLSSPVIVNDLLVIGMINSSWGDQSKGKAGNRLLALNKRDGTPVWWSEISLSPGTYMSTPVVATINGQLLLITGGSDGALHGLQAGTGKEVWSYKFCMGAINCSPTVDGTLVYANHGEESPGTNVQGRIICIDAGQVDDKGRPKLVWQKDGIQAKFTTPLVQGGRVYICDDVCRIHCFDAKTGAHNWEFIYGQNSMGSPVWGDGKIYVAEVNSKFHILEPGDKKCKRLQETFFPSPDGVTEVELNGTPAVSDGKIYFSAGDVTYCIGTKDGKAGSAPAAAAEIKKGKPAQLLIYPCDVVAHAGATVPLQLKVYDEYGNFLEDVGATTKETWSLPQPPLPPGAKNQPPALQAEIEVNGSMANLKLGKAPVAQQGYVEAQWKGLKAKARVRVAPTLPYAQDFDKVPEGAAPAGWVNCQNKFVVKKLTDGNNVLAKVTDSDNPLIARGQCFFGSSNMTDYTIEADVWGGKVNNRMPDVGVGACRYTLMLTGQTQALRLVSWDAMPRVDKSFKYEFKPDTWYRLKLTAEVAGGKTTLRCKAWDRSAAEPAAWNIEFTDPTPNLEGAPFLYGYVLGHDAQTPRGTEVYYDNVKVTPNTKK
ncbi:MAG TPA: PQQ-binding-like beta-propeller repeat protein [Gemmataceae bacterium]|nr:PQQ-binding-like beta-propeller repeat protein [Gemmataceae bacterium]